MIRPHYVGVFQSICTSERMAALSNDSHRLFFLQLLTQCDSHGRTEASAVTLNGRVWPLLEKTAAQTEKALLDLERAGLVGLYVVEGRRYLQVVQWDKFAGKVGRPDKRGDSLWPEPPVDAFPTSRENGGLVGPRARVGSDRIGSDRIGSEEEGTGGEERPVEVETWPKVFAEFPDLDCADTRGAYRSLLEMRKRKRFGEWAPDTLRKNLRAFAVYGPQALADAMRESDRCEWKGVFTPKGPRGAPPVQNSMRAILAAKRAAQERPDPVEVPHADIR